MASDLRSYLAVFVRQASSNLLCFSRHGENIKFSIRSVTRKGSTDGKGKKEKFLHCVRNGGENELDDILGN